jgi:hypothetical protein
MKTILISQGFPATRVHLKSTGLILQKWIDPGLPGAPMTKESDYFENFS